MDLIIEHNSDTYKIDLKKAVEVSNFFAKQFTNLKLNPKYQIQDLHSSSAFDSFVKILSSQPTYVLEKDMNQVESLLKEYKVKEKYLNHFNQFVREKTDRKFSLKGLDGKIYSLNIRDDDTEDALRKRIQETTGIQQEKQILLIEGQILMKVRDALKFNSRKIIMVDKTPPISLEVGFFDENTFIEISGDEKLEQLCKIVADRLGGNVDIMIPYSKGKKLDKNQTLNQCGIVSGDYITIQTH